MSVPFSSPYIVIFIFNVGEPLKCIQMYIEPLFVINIQWLLCIYLSMCYEPCAFIWACESDSKCVGSDKLLESVLGLMDICVIANVHYYV